jgi:hypothetical protein
MPGIKIVFVVGEGKSRDGLLLLIQNTLIARKMQTYELNIHLF